VPHGAICSTLIPEKSGYTFTARNSLTVNSNLSNIDFKGTPVPRSISGKVYEGTDSSSGTGISSAVVKCTTSSQTYQSQSGSDGRYTISGVPHGAICSTLIPEKSGYTFTARNSLTVNSNLSSIDFKGTSNTSVTHSISGKVYDGADSSSGTGISGAVVKCTGSNSNVYQSQPTGTSGTYSISGIPHGTICSTLVPQKTGYTFAARTNFAVSSDLSNIDFKGTAAIREVITHFYNTVLGRDPEPGAVEDWENGYFNYSLSYNIDVRLIVIEMGRAFFSSDEYQTRNRSNSQFITDCYQAFLYRSPSAGELNSWLSGVWNRLQVVSMFANSDDCDDYMQKLFPGFTGLPTRNFVTTMYIGFLNRLVDGGGLIYWSNLFDEATDKRAMSKYMGQQLVGSPEFQSSHPSNETIVTSLYRAYLGRFPADGEITCWAGELNAGRQSLNDLINQFANSQEFSEILQWYFSF
jgi:hypothetical protein